MALNQYDAINGVLRLGSFAVLVYAGLGFAANPYGYVTIIQPIHSWTLLIICAAFIISVERLRFLPVPIRQLYAAGLVVAGTSLYDSLYAVTSALTGHPASIFPMIGLAVALGVLMWLDAKSIYLKNSNAPYIMLGITTGCFYALAAGGFFDAMLLYDTAGGPDPNVNPFWLLSKLACLLIFPLSTMQGNETREVRATL